LALPLAFGPSAGADEVSFFFPFFESPLAFVNTIFGPSSVGGAGAGFFEPPRGG
jgi:hypothetical protein